MEIESKNEKTYKVYQNIRDEITIFNLSLTYFFLFIGFFLFIFILSISGIGNGVIGSLFKVMGIGLAFFSMRFVSKNKHTIRLLRAQKFPDEINFNPADFN